MKKTLIIIGIFILFLFIYFLQINFFSWYNIAGVQPNLFIILSLFIGLYLGGKYGLYLGVIFGLLLDLFLAKRLGINAIALGIAGMLGGFFNKNFSKEGRLALMLMVAGTTILCELITYIIQIIFIGAEFIFLNFIYLILIETIYNIILIIILYPIIQKIGNSIEDTFRKNSMFSKYI